MQKLTLTGRSLWWPFPCRVCGTSPRAPSPRGSPWGRPRPRPPPGDGGAREGGGGLRGGGAAPEGVARCAASPGAREAWAASSPVHQDRLDDDGATLPPLPPGRLLPRACADPSLNLQRYRISCTERDLANLGQIGIYANLSEGLILRVSIDYWDKGEPRRIETHTIGNAVVIIYFIAGTVK